jgi:hypothetical protein
MDLEPKATPTIELEWKFKAKPTIELERKFNAKPTIELGWKFKAKPTIELELSKANDRIGIRIKQSQR